MLTGRDGEHYRAALELLSDTEAAIAEAEAAAAAVAGMEFVWIPAGDFQMGLPDEEPVTHVRISQGYWLGRYEVTQAAWQAVMGTASRGSPAAESARSRTCLGTTRRSSSTR